MGPLVPGIISAEFNYIIALLLGIAFGFVLEQAGFSSSRKLAGVFYGYDFTVLRVFFTAAITAMTGILFMGYFGLLDLSIIYVNPTYLGSMILGGVIMGAGFITGGFCPGTSISAAAIGKIDAMVFLAGILIGVFAFGEIYPMVENFYLGSAFGDLKVYDALGLSRGVFAFLIIFIAIFAFVVTAQIEKKVLKQPIRIKKQLKLSYVLPISFALIVGAALIFLPDRESRLLAVAESQEQLNTYNFDFIDADELAYRISDEDPELLLIDLRSPDKFKDFSLPYAINVPFTKMIGQEWKKILDREDKKIVYYSDTEEFSKKAAILANRLGYAKPQVLTGGLHTFRSQIMNFPKESEMKDTVLKEFRLQARRKINKLIEESKAKHTKPEIVKRRKVSGGC